MRLPLCTLLHILDEADGATCAFEFAVLRADTISIAAKIKNSFLLLYIKWIIRER